MVVIYKLLKKTKLIYALDAPLERKHRLHLSPHGNLNMKATCKVGFVRSFQPCTLRSWAQQSLSILPGATPGMDNDLRPPRLIYLKEVATV